jgi:membrane protein YdbS with pleckstrin-like domain
MAIAASNDDWPLPFGVLAAGGSLLMGGWCAVYSMLRYASWGYVLRELDVVIQSGVWWKVRRCIPRSRVQHVDIASGPLDRAFGLVEVHLFTAGASGAVAQIPGLSPEAAEHLRAALVRSTTDGV